VATDARIREDIPHINSLILSTTIGKTVPVTLQRAGKEITVNVTTEGRGKAHGDDEELRGWGITGQNLTRFSALALHRSDTKGVAVVTLRNGAPASEAKPPLQPNDIIVSFNGKPVDNIETLRTLSTELTKDKESPVPALIGYERNFLKLMTVVKIGKEAPKEQPMLAKKAWLPASTQVLTQDLAKAFNLEGKPGVRVTRVYAGRSAEKAGLKVGDILLKLDGDPIEASRPEDSEVLSTLIRQRSVGSEATFDAVRDGQPVQVKVTLEAPPSRSNELKHYEDDNFEFSVRELSFEERLDRETPESEGGVLIDMVQRAGWASMAMVQGGDILLAIDGKPVSTADGVKDALKEIKAHTPKQVVFFVKRDRQTVYLEIEPIWEKNNGQITTSQSAKPVQDSTDEKEKK
ncbi:TPA: hypothetical protein DDW35_11010, partial [Candidatus Sumerlaeota bacterium]|nr:hypothetical protein [Candidatus Sumerlaeota bacterium]